MTTAEVRPNRTSAIVAWLTILLFILALAAIPWGVWMFWGFEPAVLTGLSLLIWGQGGLHAD